MGDENKTNGGNVDVHGNVVVPGQDMTLAECFEATRAEIEALPRESLKQVFVDLAIAAMTVSGCQQKIARFRAQVVEVLPKTNMRYFDELERYVGALQHAHAMHNLLLEEEAPIAEWADQLAENHELLSNTAEIAATQGLMNASVLASVKIRNTNALLITNTMKLVDLFRHHWPKLENKTMLTLDMLAAMESDARRLARAIGARDQRIAAISASADTRNRTYSVFVRAYSEVRRAIGYIRWFEGDADLYAPALSANHGKRKSSGTDDEADGASDAETSATKPVANDQTLTGAPVLTPAPAPVAQPSTGPTGGPFVR